MKRRLASNAEQVKSAVLACLTDLLPEWLPGGAWQGHEYVSLNPNRVDRNLGSFRIDSRTGSWRDHAIGKGGRDAFSLYAYLFTDGDYRAAFKGIANHPKVRAAIATGAMPPPAKTAKPLKSRTTKLALVKHTYNNAGALLGTPADTYLQSRGLHPTGAWEPLRASAQHYPGLGACPALIAPIEDPSGSLAGLHLIYLQPNGSKLAVPGPKRTWGQVRGCAIRLGHAIDELTICEGLEDGLTLYQVFGTPVWVACGVGLLKSMVIPDTIKSLTIAADNDAAGMSGAQEAGDAHNVSGRCVNIMRPSPGFRDFNDELRGIRRGK